MDVHTDRRQYHDPIIPYSYCMLGYWSRVLIDWLIDWLSTLYSRLLVFRTNISKASSNQRDVMTTLQQSMLAWEYCLTTVRKPSETSRCVSAEWLLLLLWQPRQLENLLDGLMIWCCITWHSIMIYRFETTAPCAFRRGCPINKGAEQEQQDD